MPKGGDVKRAPVGFYTARQAAERLGLRLHTFHYYVQKGRIKRTVPPLRVEGYYEKEYIDKLADELALFLHTEDPTSFVTEVTNTLSATTTIHVARPEDAPGIVSVLTIRGWQAASAEQRISWYAINPLIDFVAHSNGEVVGYIHAVPYTPEALAAMMSGQKRAWHITPQDILPYKPGNTYDIYIGIATKPDELGHTQPYGRRLISGFLTFLRDLAKQKIFIRRIYAVSAEPDGQKLCNDLGFQLQTAEEGDLFPRYMLNMETSDNFFARRYREAAHRH